jgi:glutathione S-transferase
LNLVKGEVRTPEFRSVNPFGRVPFIIEDGFKLGESNAILLYLARGSRLLPADARAQALVQQWMFFEQNQVELSIGLPRIWKLLGMEQPAPLWEHYKPRAVAGLKVLERHLVQHRWLAGDAYSVADISLFAYTHLAPDAGHDLSQFPAVSAWLQRFREQPDWFAME